MIPSALGRLADRLGIQRGFHQIDGTPVPATVEALRAICRALGRPAETESDAIHALAAIADEEALSLAPATVVLPAEAPGRSLVLRRAAQWRLTPEEGPPVEGRTGSEHRVVLPPGLPAGYHRLDLFDGHGHPASVAVVVAPPSCVDIGIAAGGVAARGGAGGRVAGLSTQLYALRDARESGIGDLTTLGALLAGAGARGFGLVGINPLHALFPDLPEAASPYSPSSRLWLNPLMIDPAAVPEWGRPAEDGPAAALIDYPHVTRARLDALRAAFAAFEAAADPRRLAAFEAFRARAGIGLYRFATCLALRAHLAAEGPVPPVEDWPEDWRHAEAPGVASFAEAHADSVAFQEWVQFEAARQLGAAATAPGAAGILADLAVGTGFDSADRWADPDGHAEGVSIGSPPDPFSPSGQNWSLVPLRPDRLPDDGYARFAALLRAGMRHARALRIDHVMGLTRQYWLPHGLATGAYVHFPLDALLRVAALESQRHGCAVIGEDLGTVPGGFRERLAEAGILSYRIMQFERWPDGLFKRPETYPAGSLAAFGTHDLPTILGFWEGRDIEARAAAEGWPEDRRRDAHDGRAHERGLLIAALADAGLWPGPDGPELVDAIHRFLARSPSTLVIAQLEDIAGWRDQVNLPGTIRSHPNWRRRFAQAVQAIIDSEELGSAAASFLCRS